MEIYFEEIEFKTSNEQQITIFDEDYTFPENCLESDKQIPLKTKHSIEPEQHKINEQFTEQMMKSKANFYSINIVSKKKTIKNNKIPYTLGSNSNNILKQGYMQKKTDGFFFTWNKRYMVLTEEKLYSFETNKRQKIIGCINLKLLRTQLKQYNGTLILDFNQECQNLILKAQSIKQHQSWKNWFQKVIDFHMKQNKMFLKTFLKPTYDSKDSLSQKQFLKYAQTGDIILFSTDNTGAKIQRTLTNSNYDHVGLIVKFYNNHQLTIFESNQLHGVSIYQWKKYIRYFNLYQKVAIRKLNYLRKIDAQNKIINFISQTVGKDYDINAYKLLKFESEFDWKTINEQKQRGFFCSQLIAKAYKNAGLFTSRKSSGRYWPVDFTQKKQLPFRKQVKLGPQQLIILNKHLKRNI